MNKLYEAMIQDYKILVLYVLKNIEIIDIRKTIWEKIFDPETEELMKQEWFEIDEIWQDIDEIIGFDLNDLEIQYSD